MSSMRLPTPLSNFIADAVIDLRDSGQGELRTTLIKVVYGVPVAVVASMLIIVWRGHFNLSPASMFLRPRSLLGR